MGITFEMNPADLLLGFQYLDAMDDNKNEYLVFSFGFLFFSINFIFRQNAKTD